MLWKTRGFVSYVKYLVSTEMGVTVTVTGEVLRSSKFHSVLLLDCYRAFLTFVGSHVGGVCLSSLIMGKRVVLLDAQEFRVATSYECR